MVVRTLRLPSASLMEWKEPAHTARGDADEIAESQSRRRRDAENDRNIGRVGEEDLLIFRMGTMQLADSRIELARFSRMRSYQKSCNIQCHMLTRYRTKLEIHM